MTFKQFLVGRRARYDALGDFTRLALADSSMPDVTSWIELRHYLEGRDTSHAHIEAAEKVWGVFQGKSQRP